MRNAECGIRRCLRRLGGASRLLFRIPNSAFRIERSACPHSTSFVASTVLTPSRVEPAAVEIREVVVGRLVGTAAGIGEARIVQTGVKDPSLAEIAVVAGGDDLKAV